MTAADIISRLAECGISCQVGQAEQLRTYLDLLISWNSRMDLTAVTGEPETLDRHFVDSLTVLTVPNLMPAAGKLIDVGTGAGFPGMVLAICLPDMQVTLLDALQKRLTFLQAVQDTLGLTNVRLVHARAEDGARQTELREQYDVAVARAVASLPVLSEYLLPYVRPGGRAICWKGPALAEEWQQGQSAVRLLGGQLDAAIPVTIPGRDWQHVLVPMRKLHATPGQYPRQAGIPSKKPLGGQEQRPVGRRTRQ